jgi:hypothetical protein
MLSGMNRSAATTFLLIATTFAASAFSANEPAETPEFLLARIKNEGAAAVIRSLWDTPRWSELTDQVASGDPGWVNVAVDLAPGSDAGSTSELNDALALALSRNPVSVLRAVPADPSDSNPIGLSIVCVGPQDPPDTYAAALGELKAAEAAVRAIHDKALAGRRDLCLKKLTTGKDALKQFFEVR